MAKAGLRKVTKTVRGKHGSVRRSYWMKSQGGASHIKGLLNPGAAAYKKSSGRASASAGARVGLMTGLLGAHRIRGGILASEIGAQALAHGQRKQYGQRGRSIFGKLGHGIATEVGHAVGQLAGATVHEGVRHVIRRARGR